MIFTFRQWLSIVFFTGLFVSVSSWAGSKTLSSDTQKSDLHPITATEGRTSLNSNPDTEHSPKPKELEDSEELRQIKQELAQIKERYLNRHAIVDNLHERLKDAKGVEQEIYHRRLLKEQKELVLLGLEYVELALDNKKVYPIETAHRTDLIEILKGTPDNIAESIAIVQSKINIPDRNLGAAEEASAYALAYEQARHLNEFSDMFYVAINKAREIDLPVDEQVAKLKHSLHNRAENLSMYLEVAIIDARSLNAGVKALPTDDKIKAKLTMTEARITEVAQLLDAVVDDMERLQMPTAIYREQIISATGQVSAEVLKTDILARLLQTGSQKVLNFFVEEGPDIALKMLLFLMILIIARKLSNLVKKLTTKALNRSGSRVSTLLRRMIISTMGNLIYLLGFLVALSQLGLSLGPLLAGLGVAGFIVGFAMQDVLSNFAAGIMILIYRPFDVGDVVEAGGVFGSVSKMNLVSTTILTFDNQTIVVPNNKIWGDVIKNLTYQRTRRVDLTFSIGYRDDIAKTEAVLAEIVEKETRILDTPEPIIRLHELAESSLNFVVRSWVKTEDYWEVYWHLVRTVKLRFDEEGISIPFPQRDLHLNTTGPLRVEVTGDKTQ